MLFTKKQYKEFLQKNNYKDIYYHKKMLDFFINHNSNDVNNDVWVSILEQKKNKGVTKIIISLHVGKKRVSGYFNTTLDTWKKEENKTKWIDYLYKHCMLEEVG
nr:MAG TPA: hypothetical protein [Caudoviricetes sp.]